MRDSAEMLIYEYLYLKVKQTFLKYLAWTLGFCDALRCLCSVSGSASGSDSGCVFTTISQICICVCVFVHLHISDIGRYVNRCPWTQYAAILHMTSMRSQFLLLLKCSLKCCHEKCNGMADHSRYTYRYIYRYAVKTLLADTSLKRVSSFNEPSF